MTDAPTLDPDWILEVRQWLQDRGNTHAAAVSAERDAEIAQLRADNTRLQNEVVMPLRENWMGAANTCSLLHKRIKVLEDALTKIEQVAALTVEYDHAVEQAAKNCDEVLQLREYLDAAQRRGEELRAQVAALEVDAGRYRWLRDKFSRIACNVNLAWDAAQAETTKIESLWEMEHFRATDPESTDAAIDAARGATCP